MKLAELEKRLLQLEKTVKSIASSKNGGWKSMAGQFAGDEDFAEVVKLIEEQRASERPERPSKSRKVS